MSWRDRLARHEAAEQRVAISANSANSPLSRPIGTNGTIGNDEKTATAAVSQYPRAPTEAGLGGSIAALETGIRTGWGDAEDERAAIVEHDGGVPRGWAEGFAALAAMPPPAGFWPDRWQRIIDATGAFLDRWAGEVVRCGWTHVDVFGCDPGAPDRRFDCRGLVLLLDRNEVVAIDRDGADLVTVTDARQRFRRRKLPLGTAPPWNWCGDEAACFPQS